VAGNAKVFIKDYYQNKDGIILEVRIKINKDSMYRSHIFRSIQPHWLAVLLAFTAPHVAGQTIRGPLGEVFKARIVAKNLTDPWEITCGPDNHLWVTESKNYLVSRINPLDGKKMILLDLNHNREFPRYDLIVQNHRSKPWPQGGLMGMALHPDLLNGHPYVYLMYIYEFKGASKSGRGCEENFGGCGYRGRIVRYTYDRDAQKLSDPEIVCNTIPQSNDHNGGRLAIAVVDGKPFLFCSVGDMGAGQFGNAGQVNRAQDKTTLEGKILRFNTEPDADTEDSNKWIPNDNPFNGIVQNAVWSLGHRNAQGLASATMSGKCLLYSTEHGPFSDDEINIIVKGSNYGHPLICGYADGNYNGLAASVSAHNELPGLWNTTYPLINSEKQNASKIGKTYCDPILSIYPTQNSFLRSLYEKRLKGSEEQDWPSEAPSSIEVYTHDAIPGWKNSLLIPTLKGNKLIRLKLNEDGNKLLSDTICYFNNKCRYRDIAVSNDGLRIYLSVDNTPASSNPAKEDPKQVHYPGTIIEFTYIPAQEDD